MRLQTLLNRLESYILVSLIEGEGEEELLKRTAWDKDLEVYGQRFVAHIGADKNCPASLKVHIVPEDCEDIILP